MSRSLSLGESIGDRPLVTTMGTTRLHDLCRGRWLVLLSYPKDATPVCATEIAAIAQKFDDITALGAAVVVEDHLYFTSDIERTQGVTIKFPIIADEDASLCRELGLLCPKLPGTNGGRQSVRGLYIFSPSLPVERGIGSSAVQPPAAGLGSSSPVTPAVVAAPGGSARSATADSSRAGAAAAISSDGGAISSAQCAGGSSGNASLLPSDAEAKALGIEADAEGRLRVVPGEPQGSEAYRYAARVIRQQTCPVKSAFPAGDPGVVAKALEVFGPTALCVSMMYPPTMGRSPEELLRSLESLTTTTLHDFVGTPAGWSPGQDVVILPEISDEEARGRLVGGTFDAVAPYLRLAPDPGHEAEAEAEVEDTSAGGGAPGPRGVGAGSVVRFAADSGKDEDYSRTIVCVLNGDASVEGS